MNSTYRTIYMMILPDIQESKKPVPQDNTSEIPERVWKNFSAEKCRDLTSFSHFSLLFAALNVESQDFCPLGIGKSYFLKFWQDIVSVSWAGESLFLLGWQSPRDVILITMLASIKFPV